MAALIIAARVALAMTLLLAGGAKLASISGFAATVRLFLGPSAQARLARILSVIVVVAELAVGIVGLAWPSFSWVRLLGCALCVGFLGASVAGYALFRDHSCQCFGALSQRRFDFAGILRSVLLLAISVIALAPVDMVSIQLGQIARLLLCLGAVLLVAATFTAARALEVSAKNLKRS